MDAIDRCRQALHTDDILSVATRDDFAELLEQRDKAKEQAAGYIKNWHATLDENVALRDQVRDLKLDLEFKDAKQSSLLDHVLYLEKQIAEAKADKDTHNERAQQAIADAKSSQVVLDAIGEVLQAAGYNLPLQEQVGAVIQDRDAAMVLASDHRADLRNLLCEGHDASDYKHTPDNTGCVLCDLKRWREALNAAHTERDGFRDAVAQAYWMLTVADKCLHGEHPSDLIQAWLEENKP